MSPVIVSSRVMFSRLFLPVGLTLICVWLGWAAARTLVPERTNPTAFPLTATPTGLPTGPTQVLVLVVDDLTAPRPALDAVWVTTLTPGSAEANWVGFASDLTIEHDTLASYFSTGYGIGRSPQDGALLVEAGLGRLTGGAVAPLHRLVIDRTLVAGLVDRLGGITVVDQAMDGARMLAAYDAIGDSGPAARVSFQAAVLEACAQRLQDHSSAGLSAYLAELAPTYGLDSVLVSGWLTSGIFPEPPAFSVSLAAR